MKACIKMQSSVKKDTHKYILRPEEITLNWDEDKEKYTWEIQGQTFQAEGIAWARVQTVKNMALSGNQQVTEYDLHIG